MQGKQYAADTLEQIMAIQSWHVVTVTTEWSNREVCSHFAGKNLLRYCIQGGQCLYRKI